MEFFGGPTLWRENAPVRISPFQAGLLSLAFGTGQARMPRSIVQTLLWGSDGGQAVRHRLSQLVYQTNRRCRAKVVELDGEHVRANPQLVATDLDEFMGMIRNSDFAAACDILERGFLSAFPNRKTEAFTDWIKTRELGMRARLRNKAFADSNASEAIHDWTGARSSAEALARLDPYDEGALRRVIRAHAMGGRVGEAKAVYRAFAERADPSGGWAPQRATRKLLHSVQSVHKATADKSRRPRTQGLDNPLTGRVTELSQLSRSIGRNRTRDAWHSVTLSGEPGLGKTRLIEEAMQGARLRGSHVMYACPGEFERDIPLSPLLEALDAPWVGPLLTSVPGPWRPHLLSLLPQFDPRAKPPQQIPNVQSERLQRHTCEALLRLFTAIAQSQRTVVVLDDFHWADEATATVVQFLRRRWWNGNLTLLLAYRQEALDRNEIAARLVDELEAEPEAATIRLRELGHRASGEFVASLGAAKLADSTVRDIVKLGGGNPRYLIEITADAMAGGGSRREIRVPPSLRQSIIRRIGKFKPKVRNIMSALAVFRHPTTVQCLTGITGQTQHDCIDALDILHGRRLVDRADDKVRIRQAIVRRALYEGLSPTRRALLHKLSAEMLLSRTRSLRPDRIALHYHRAGERQLACIYALEATRPSATRTPCDRSRFLKIAYETSEGSRRQRLILPLARALHRSRQLEAAVRYGTKVLKEAPGLSPEEYCVARLIIADARGLLGRESSAATLDQFAHLEEAAARNRDEPFLAEVLDTTLRLLLREGDHDRVRLLVARTKRLEGLRHPVANCRVLATLAMRSERTDPAEGLVLARRAVTIAREHGLHTEDMLARQRHIAALAANGLLATEEGRTSVAQAEAAARKSDDLASHLLILLELAKWHTSTGALDIAETRLDNARMLAEHSDCPEIRCRANLVRANLALARGNLPASLAALGSLPALPGSASDEPEPSQGVASGEMHGEEIGHRSVPAYLVDALAALKGNVLLESGKLRQATRVAESQAIEEPLANISIDLVLFHARLLSRRGLAAEALDLLGRGAEAHEHERPLHWLRLTLDLVRLARRSGSPRPELAARAHDLALPLELTEIAHEFIPFT